MKQICIKMPQSHGDYVAPSHIKDAEEVIITKHLSDISHGI